MATALLFLSLWGSSAQASLCAPDQEIDRAIRDHFATNYCRGNGRSFDIQIDEIRIQGKSAIVSYALVFFESCEEGSPVIEVSPHKERWIRGTNGWEPASPQPVEKISSGKGGRL
jgi:hypothetical protein